MSQEHQFKDRFFEIIGIDSNSMTKNDFTRLVLLYIRLNDLKVVDDQNTITYLNMTQDLQELLNDNSERIVLYRGETPVADLNNIVNMCYEKWRL